MVTQASESVATLLTEIFELLKAFEITFLKEKSSSIIKILFSIQNFYKGNLIYTFVQLSSILIEISPLW